MRRNPQPHRSNPKEYILFYCYLKVLSQKPIPAAQTICRSLHLYKPIIISLYGVLVLHLTCPLRMVYYILHVVLCLGNSHLKYFFLDVAFSVYKSHYM